MRSSPTPYAGRSVSVIELKYWWYTADGTLYAPEGGKNLAPRQQLREWKGPKKRSIEQTARQVREYRERYPDKAILSTGGPDDGWAVLAAGGSMPEAPARDGPAAARSPPAASKSSGPRGSDDRQWTLADPGRDYLAYAAPGAAIRLDLSAYPSKFAVLRVDPETGRVQRTDESITGGRVADIRADGTGPTVLWLSLDARMSESPNP